MRGESLRGSEHTAHAMAEHIEVETQELQEKIHEEHERHGGGEGGWVRYVGLTTAILAVFAAISALQSGSLVNEALIHQIKASDTWAEYQASRQKDHLYTIALNDLNDRNVKNPSRVAQYRVQIANEAAKERALSAEARKLEEEAAQELHRQHSFEYAVALIQVAIALGAVAALARAKAAWLTSAVVGLIGIALFVIGFLP